MWVRIDPVSLFCDSSNTKIDTNFKKLEYAIQSIPYGIHCVYYKTNYYAVYVLNFKMHSACADTKIHKKYLLIPMFID